MSSLVNILILAIEAICLAGAILALHRLSPVISLLPVVFLMGGLSSALQLSAPGMFTITLPGQTITLAQGSFMLLPVILMGLLVIYVINGSQKARHTFYGLLIISLITAIFQTLPAIYPSTTKGVVLLGNPAGPLPRIPIASSLTLILDMMLLVLVYQTASNLRNRFPSRLAGGLALMVTLWGDALLFPTLAYLGRSGWASQIPINLLGKSLVGLLLWPLVSLYLWRAPETFLESAATKQRPVFDMFMTPLQLEASARYQYSLLRTISQIDQLILRSEHAQGLIEGACELLAQGREYELTWISLLEGNSSTPHFATRAGKQASDLDTATSSPITPLAAEMIEKVSTLLQPVLWKTDSRQTRFELHNRKGVQATSLRSAAAFPMRHQERILGILGVHSSRLRVFDNPQEVELLQELADNLAYALVSLEARQQQSFLGIAAKTMRDGLIITDLGGKIIYANPAVAEMLDNQLKDLQGHSIFSFMSPDQVELVQRSLLPALRQEGSFTTEVELPAPHGNRVYSLKVALVRSARNQAQNSVISVRDITSHRIYEHRLLTLNQITTELVQIHNPQELYQTILNASEELFQADSSAIFLFDEDARIEAIHPHRLPEPFLKQIEIYPLVFSDDVQGSSSQVYFVPDTSKDPLPKGHMRLMAENGLMSFLNLPIFYQSRPLGVLALYYHQPRQFQNSEIQLGLTVANSLAIALQNARLYQAEHNQSQLAEALFQATNALNSSLDLDTVLDQILEQTSRVVPCRSVNLMLIEDDRARVVRQLHRSPTGKVQSMAGGPDLPLNTATLQHILQTRQPLLIPDTVGNPIWLSLQTTTWIRSYAAAPLQIRQKVIGFLNVNSDRPNFFDQETTHRLQAFASSAAAAIHNARLYQDLRSHTQELENRVRERTAELSAAKEHIEAILASVPDAVFVLDENGQLLEANQAGEALRLQAQLNNINLFEPNFLSQLASGKPLDENTLRELQKRTYQAHASPLPLPDGQSGLVIVFRDVTRFRELDQMKTRFVSDVSHELRTPLTNLSLYLDLLAEEADIERQKRYQATLRRETERLTQLIEDLLTISRLESKRMAIYIKPVDIDLLTSQLVQDRTPMAQQRRLNLTYGHNADIPQGLADPRLLTQVLSNLLTNALNYTPADGQIHVSCECQRSNANTWITISIKDNGVGISSDEIHLIFQRFYRGSASRQTGAAGTGLGLAISNEILEQMNGHITVQSQPGKGSTFVVWLPAVL
ncbi:MAG: GAF domain-containing protein [Chloroflexota bacterium]